MKPDFHTIARFRKYKFESLSHLFADSVRLCKSVGLVSLNISLGKDAPAFGDNDLFARECFLADDERDVLVCPAGRELFV